MGNGVSNKTYAHQVTDVQPNGPGAKCGLHDGHDFIILMNDRIVMDLLPEEMKNIVVAFENKDLELKVYNSMSQSIRTVAIRPSRKWPGQGLLGISMKLVPYDGYPHIKHIIKPIRETKKDNVENIGLDVAPVNPIQVSDNPMSRQFTY